jgi:hypothetical protein
MQNEWMWPCQISIKRAITTMAKNNIQVDEGEAAIILDISIPYSKELQFQQY